MARLTMAEKLAVWSVPSVTKPGCVEWTRSRQHNGYGRLANGRVIVLAHRAAWIVAHGPVPDGLRVLHRCDNPPCVNPAHLRLGTPKENTADMISKGRKRKPHVKAFVAALEAAAA